MINQSKLESLSISDLQVVAQRSAEVFLQSRDTHYSSLCIEAKSLIDKRINELISDK